MAEAELKPVGSALYNNGQPFLGQQLPELPNLPNLPELPRLPERPKPHHRAVSQLLFS